MSAAAILTEKILDWGADFAAPVDPAGIVCLDELRDICVRNDCGMYGTNWGCPPGCGEMRVLRRRPGRYEGGVVFQHVGGLDGSFDWEGMMAHKVAFSALARRVRELTGEGALVLGAGGCDGCAACAYPGPCVDEARRVVSMEAYGIDVAGLCAAAGLEYMNGEGTVTYTGLLLF